MHKRIVATLLVLIGLVLVAAVNINFFVARNKDYLLERLTRTLGHTITADKIEIGYQPLAVRLTNLNIAGAATDATTPLVMAKESQINLRVLPLLLGQLQPGKITLDSAVVTIVRDLDGRYNYEPQGGNRQSARARSETIAPDRQLFAITALQVTNGTLRYRDLNNGDDLIVAQIRLTLSDLAPDEAIDIDLEAAVMAAKSNFKFTSRIGPIAEIRNYRDFPIEGALDATQLDIGKVNRALPQLRKATPRHLRFDGIYDIKSLKFKGTLNNLSLKGAVSGTDASFRFE
ncbi:MAG TPA: AsmA family protein [Candidatus Limnocylindria bacterium]|nr:AsmA family protein [Candidatus Limnocylindria bacterium]